MALEPFSFGDHDDDAEDDHDVEPSDQIGALCQQALQLIDAGQIDDARMLAFDALDLDADHPFTAFVLGVLADRDGDAAGARYLAQRALDGAVTNADAILFRAQLHVADGEFDEAEHLLRFGIVYHPDDPLLHEHLARVLLARGAYDEALRAAQASLELDPGNVAAHGVRAAAMDSANDIEAMLAALRQAARLHPDDIYLALDLAAAEASAGEFDRAHAALARADRLDPGNAATSELRHLLLAASTPNRYRYIRPLVRMARTFPGGFAGLWLAWAICFVPLDAIAQLYPDAALPARILSGILLAVVLGAFIGEDLLNRRVGRAELALPRHRGSRSADALAETLQSCVASGRATRCSDIAQRRAAGLPPRERDAVYSYATHMRTVRARLRARATATPAAARVLLSCAIVGIVAAQSIAALLGVEAYVVAITAAACAGAAWWVHASYARLYSAISRMAFTADMAPYADEDFAEDGAEVIVLADRRHGTADGLGDNAVINPTGALPHIDLDAFSTLDDLPGFLPPADSDDDADAPPRAA